MPLVYLSLGTNLGDRCDYLRRALRELSRSYRVDKVSSVYQTAAWGKTDQPDFLNQVVAIETEDDPYAVLARLQAIEQQLDRVRHERWGPRTIDLDILFFGDRVIRHPQGRLEVPHPRLWQRAFVLIPLLEIAPDMVFGGRHLARELAGLDDQTVRWYAASATDC